ncbi:MAG: T9SS type A sorting domain-containing protein [Bacteroidota bacterium]
MVITRSLFRSLAVLLYFGVSFSLHAQQWRWARGSLGTSSELGVALANAPANGVYLGAIFQDSLQMDTAKAIAKGSGDFFLARYDSSGSQLWGRGWGGNGLDQLRDLASTPSGKCYVAGDFGSSFIWGPDTIAATGRNFFLAAADSNGSPLWAIAGGGESSELGRSISIADSGKIYLTGSFNSDTFRVAGNEFIGTGNREMYLAHFDTSGKFLWLRQSTSTGQCAAQDVVATPDGGALVCGLFRDSLYLDTFRFESNGVADVFLAKYASNGMLEWVNQFAGPAFEIGWKVTVLENGYGYLAGQFDQSITLGSNMLNSQGDEDLFLAHFDPEGNILWARGIGGSGREQVGGIDVDTAGNVFLSGQFEVNVDFGGGRFFSTGDTELFVAKYDRLGQLLWVQNGQNSSMDGSRDVLFSAPGKLYTTGFFVKQLILGSDSLSGLQREDLFLSSLLDLDTTSIPFRFTNRISGSIFWDENSDCALQSGELGLANWVIRVLPDACHTLSDSMGRYTLELDTGTYQIEILPPKPLAGTYQISCPIAPLILDTIGLTMDTINQGFVSAQEPFVEINLSGSQRIPCQPGVTTIQVINRGTDTAFNRFVRLEYPAEITPHSNFTQDQDGSISIALPAIPPQEHWVFQVPDSTSCSSDIGRVLTVKGTITPYIPSAPAWQGAELEARINCVDKGNRVELILKNGGTGPMTDSSLFRVFANDRLHVERKALISSGDSLRFWLEHKARTIRLESQQAPEHPFKQVEIAVLEGCQTAGSSSQLGFASQFFLQDAQNPFEDAVSAVVQPMAVSQQQEHLPIGIETLHYTPKQSEISYTLRFQNRQADSLKGVEFIDTLDVRLDLSSLRIQGSSHPVNWTLEGKGRPVLKVELMGAVAPGDQVWTRFALQAVDSVPNGTVIENRVWVAADSTPPVDLGLVFNTLLDTILQKGDSLFLEDCLGPPLVAMTVGGSSVCGLDTVNLRATPPFSGQGMWQTFIGNSTIRDSLSFNTQATSLQDGRNSWIWTVSRCEQIAADTLSVFRDTVPTAVVLQPQRIEFCLGDSASFLAPNGYARYLWSDGVENQSRTFLKSTTLSLQVSGPNDCLSPVSNDLVVFERPLPVAPIIFQQRDSLVINTPFLVQWYDSTGPISGADTLVFIPDSTGRYWVSVTDTFGCVAFSDTFLFTTPTSLSRGISLDDWQVYPNPARDMIYVHTGHQVVGSWQVEVIDLAGKVLVSFDQTSSNRLSIDLSAYPSGMYLLRVHHNHQQVIRKIQRLAW